MVPGLRQRAGVSEELGVSPVDVDKVARWRRMAAIPRHLRPPVPVRCFSDCIGAVLEPIREGLPPIIFQCRPAHVWVIAFVLAVEAAWQERTA